MAAPRGLPSSPVQHGTGSGDHNGLLSAPSGRIIVPIPPAFCAHEEVQIRPADHKHTQALDMKSISGLSIPVTGE